MVGDQAVQDNKFLRAMAGDEHPPNFGHLAQVEGKTCILGDDPKYWKVPGWRGWGFLSFRFCIASSLYGCRITDGRRDAHSHGANCFPDVNRFGSRAG